MTRKNVAVTLTHERLLEVLDYFPTTGKFAWKSRDRRPSAFIGEPGTVAGNGRRYICIDKRMHLAHRLAWYFVTGVLSDKNISAKNGNYLDLRFCNLQELSPSETTARSQKSALRSSGVSWDKKKKKWFAKITVNYKQIAVGRFKTKAEAVAACSDARKNYDRSTVSDDPSVASIRENTRIENQMRRLWQQVQAKNNEKTGWASFEDFAAEIATLGLRRNRSLIAINDQIPIGPANCQWKETIHSAFDTKTRDGINAYNRAHRQAFPAMYRNVGLTREFGITLADYQKMFVDQGGVCACCGRRETEMRNGKVRWLAVDHDHATGAIRGLLCGSCNRGIGKFRDDPELLREGAAYLERHAERIKSNPESNVIPLKANSRRLP